MMVYMDQMPNKLYNWMLKLDSKKEDAVDIILQIYISYWSTKSI